MNRFGKASIGVGFVVALGAGIFSFYLTRAEADTGLLPYRDAEVVAQGEALYRAYCASCHGTDLEGEPNWRERDAEGYLPAPPHDASGHTWHHPDALLIRITALGSEAIVGRGYKSRMIGFQDQLDREDIIAVLAYIKSTWPAEVIEQHNRINAQSSG